MHTEESTTNSFQESVLNQAREETFRILLETGKPLRATTLAAKLGHTISQTEKVVSELERRGLICRNEEGAMVGSFGFSVVPSRDEIHIGEQKFWTWCAKTSLGILGALGRGGSILSHCPVSGRELRVIFDGAHPLEERFVVFWPSSEFTQNCSSAFEEVCPNINFFESCKFAESWVVTNRIPGEILSLEDATVRATEHWISLVTCKR